MQSNRLLDIVSYPLPGSNNHLQGKPEIKKALNEVESQMYKFLVAHRLRREELFQFLFIADGQLVTAFCTAACQHFPAIGSLHPFAKTVNGLTTAAMGLKCTFHF
jgi:hypothetical protein